METNIIYIRLEKILNPSSVVRELLTQVYQSCKSLSSIDFTPPGLPHSKLKLITKIIINWKTSS